MLLMATKEPGFPIASATATESSLAFSNSGPTSSVGRSPRVSWWSRGTSSERAGKTGRAVVQEGQGTLVLEDDVRGLIARDDLAEAAGGVGAHWRRTLEAVGSRGV